MRLKAARTLVVLVGGHIFWKVSVLLFVSTDSLGRTPIKGCHNYTDSSSSDGGLTLEMFRRIADERARLSEEFPDEDVALCPLPGLPEEVWRGVQDLINRKAWLRKICRDSPPKPRRDYQKLGLFYIMKPIGVSFCGNPKTGSTTWKAHLLKWLNHSIENLDVGRIHDNAFSEDIQSYAGKEDYLKNEHPLTFLSSRHPHDRLVSAYRDKIQGDSDEEPAFKERLYRTTHGRTLQEVLLVEEGPYPDPELLYFGENIDTVISFPEFVRYIIKRFTECKGLTHDPQHLIFCLFPYHGHWWPMYANCQLCEIEYDILSKMESHDADYAVMEHILAASHRILPPSSSPGQADQRDEGASANKKTSSHSSKCPKKGCRLNSSIDDRNKTRDNVKQYMAQLTQEEKAYLDKLYYYDFLLFGYDPYEYTSDVFPN